MAAEVWEALYEADRLKWWPPREKNRENELLAVRRAERAARARRRTRRGQE